MNLLFAIGAKYSHLVGAEWRGDERDHLIYMTRAVHLLGLKNTVVAISGPDRELLQAVGDLYLMSKPVLFMELTPRFTDWYIILLLPIYRACKQSLDHDRSFITARPHSWVAPSE